MADADLVSLLESVSLGHLSTPLTGKSLSVLQSELAEKGRPAFLSDLKAIGVDKLPERQKLATTIAKAARGALPVAPASTIASLPAPMATAVTAAKPVEGYKEPAPEPGESREAWLERMAALPGCGGCSCGACDADGSASCPLAAAAVDVSDHSAATNGASSASGGTSVPPPPGVYRWLVDIEVWQPTPAAWKYLLDSLPPADAEKVMKFKFVADQKRALVSRLLQRRACYEATGVAWSDVSIARTKGGKPFMANKPTGVDAPQGLAPNWNFNVSHEGKYVVLASEPMALCGVDVAAPEESRAMARKRVFSEQLDMIKGQLSPSEWNEIVRHKPNERLMEDAFRKFWSLKEAYTKGRGDGLGFEFRRCDFALNPTLDKGANAQQVQRATVKVDGLAIPQWGFYIQPLEADHWISVARGPPRDMVDANGEFRKTFGTLAPELGPELERAEHAFEKKTVAELIADDMRAQYATLC